MDPARRDHLVTRISSGTVRLRVGGRVFVVRRPTRDQLYVAQEVHDEALAGAREADSMDGPDLLEFLYEYGLWDESREAQLSSLPKEVDQFKERLYRASYRTNERKAVRAALAAARARLAALEAERHAFDHLTCDGVASQARGRYLVAVSLHTPGGERVFPDDPHLSDGSDLLDGAVAAWAASRLTEAEFRELARTDPWRGVWGCRRAAGSVFGPAAADYTDEQRSLVAFSCLYDSVREHPECPPDDVVEDDDCLDGWLIVQQKERDRRLAGREGEAGLGSEKVRSAQEVYLVADTPGDAERVMALNDDHARAVQRKRFEHLRRHGVVSELDMPDTRRRLAMEANQLASQSAK